MLQRCEAITIVSPAMLLRHTTMSALVRNDNILMFKNAYKRLIEPLPDRTQWPKVDLPTDLGAPLDKRSVGRQRKQKFKSCLEGGGGGGGKKPSEEAEKAKKRIKGPFTCPRCGLKGHRKNSPKCHMNGTKKRKRKPRKNTTKGWFPKEVSTTIMAANISELEANAIMSVQDSPTLTSEGTSSQALQMVTSTPTKQATLKRAFKKITKKSQKSLIDVFYEYNVESLYFLN